MVPGCASLASMQLDFVASLGVISITYLTLFL